MKWVECGEGGQCDGEWERCEVGGVGWSGRGRV